VFAILISWVLEEEICSFESMIQLIRRERVDDLAAEIIGCLLYLIIIVLYVLGRS
jgi:hypothetical protein